MSVSVCVSVLIFFQLYFDSWEEQVVNGRWWEDVMGKDVARFADLHIRQINQSVQNSP